MDKRENSYSLFYIFKEEGEGEGVDRDWIISAKQNMEQFCTMNSLWDSLLQDVMETKIRSLKKSLIIHRGWIHQWLVHHGPDTTHNQKVPRKLIARS